MAADHRLLGAALNVADLRRSTDFYDEEQIKAVYYPECERVMQRATGAVRVVAFDHIVRNATMATIKDSASPKGQPPRPRKRYQFSSGGISGRRGARLVGPLA